MFCRNGTLDGFAAVSAGHEAGGEQDSDTSQTIRVKTSLTRAVRAGPKVPLS